MWGLILLPNLNLSSYHCCLNSKNTNNTINSIKPGCAENTPEGDLRAEFHLHIIDLINAPQHQIDLDVCWSIGGIHWSGSNPGVVDILIENVICWKEGFVQTIKNNLVGRVSQKVEKIRYWSFCYWSLPRTVFSSSLWFLPSVFLCVNRWNEHLRYQTLNKYFIQVLKPHQEKFIKSQIVKWNSWLFIITVWHKLKL